MSGLARNQHQSQLSYSQKKHVTSTTTIEPDYRVINSKHNKHNHRGSRSHEKVNKLCSDKLTYGSNISQGCLVVKSKSEMRISRTREYCIMDPAAAAAAARISSSHGCMAQLHPSCVLTGHKYHDYMNVVIPQGKGIVKEQMKMVVGDLESVLGELQTVVGDLRVLVDQIDIVTSKIDEEYGSEKRSIIESGQEKGRQSTSIRETSCSKQALKLNIPRHPSPQTFDLIRRKMSSDYVYHAPVHSASKKRSKSSNDCDAINKSTSLTDFHAPYRKSSLTEKCAVNHIKTHQENAYKVRSEKTNETQFPVRLRMTNEFYERAKRAHQQKLLQDKVIIDSATNYTAMKCDINSNQSKEPIPICPTILDQEKCFQNPACQKSVTKHNKQQVCEDKESDEKSSIIPSPLSQSEHDYCGLYEHELDLKLELEYDDYLDNYNGVDEGNTLELKNYTDYKLLSKSQNVDNLQAWRAYPPVGTASVDLNTIQFSDDLKITTPTETSSDILNDNIASSAFGTSRDNSISIFDIDTP